MRMMLLPSGVLTMGFDSRLAPLIREIENYSLHELEFDSSRTNSRDCEYVTVYLLTPKGHRLCLETFMDLSLLWRIVVDDTVTLDCSYFSDAFSLHVNEYLREIEIPDEIDNLLAKWGLA